MPQGATGQRCNVVENGLFSCLCRDSIIQSTSLIVIVGDTGRLKGAALTIAIAY